MYPISPLYADYLRRKDREFLVKANIAGIEYDNRVIVDFEIDNSLVLGDEFAIGTTTLSKLTIKLRTNDIIPSSAKVVPYLALSMTGVSWDDAEFAWQDADFPWSGGPSSWLPLGEFYVDSRSKVNDVWEFTCYDKLVFADAAYISSLPYPATMKAVWDEICTRLGYTYDSSVVINPAYQIQAGPAGYSMRQILGYIASANNASVFAGKDGTIKFKRFSAAETPVFNITGSDYIRAVQINPIKTYTRVVVTYNTEDGLTYEAGSGDENHTLYVENPFATQAMVNNLHAQLNGLSYLPVAMDAMGFPQLEHGDCIGFSVDEGLTWENATIPWQDMDIPWDGIVHYKTFILHKVYSFKGGLKMSIEAPSKSEQQSEFVVEGTLSQQVNKINRDAVKQGRSYYGATITRTEGLIVEREDHASKVVLNSDEMTFYKGSDKAIWFDLPSNRYKFKGTLEAADGVFSGSLSAATGTFAGSLSAATGTFAGNLSAAGGTFTGALSAATGTFAGSLSAATGTFSGNLSAAGGTFTGTLVAANGSFSGTITAATINGGTITGAVIRTASSYPYSIMDTTGNYFGAYASANNYIKVSPFYFSSPRPVLSFTNGGFDVTFDHFAPGYFKISALELHLDANVFITDNQTLWVNDWSRIITNSGNLETELTNIGYQIMSKASAGVSTGQSGGHNHGIPDGTVLRTADGGTVTYFSAPNHSHAQV
ncbi:DUF3672 domain-containing protein [Paenibacillus oenotherae]|uniref:DUF3672 domain-containing protein n=1 Tax=Paenibacillus oenotherae TaxID=1435645 RepID=A0ABS7D7N5_9BACL|nr:DUF3672 domain-containing protein [Paenibacillus oenotherae]MBW7475955.1 DUF3672 domain-containing protein [Paenibacillus oenotherae]